MRNKKYLIKVLDSYFEYLNFLFIMPESRQDAKAHQRRKINNNKTKILSLLNNNSDDELDLINFQELIEQYPIMSLHD